MAQYLHKEAFKSTSILPSLIQPSVLRNGTFGCVAASKFVFSRSIIGSITLQNVKIFRRFCILSIGLAGLLFARPSKSKFDTVPFPGERLAVKMLADIKKSGDYRLVAAMPVVDQQLALSKESVACSLEVVVTREGSPPITNQITSMSLTGEYGFAQIRYYDANLGHLSRGEYYIQITSRNNSPAASSRGATLTIEQFLTRPTERFLLQGLLHSCAVFLFALGIVGLVVCDFLQSRKDRKIRESGEQKDAKVSKERTIDH